MHFPMGNGMLYLSEDVTTIQERKKHAMYIYSNVTAGLLYVETDAPINDYCVTDIKGNPVECPKMSCKKKGEGYITTLDAENLELWSDNHPVLYNLEADGETVRFGHTAIRTLQQKMVLLNEKPIYLRGYIRGIIAHDHPNMTGGTDYEAAVKNIRQAKKYGFNLVRFHSTIPSDDFLQAADELGMLVHLETGFTYEWIYHPVTNTPMKKVVKSFGEGLWEETILRLRNHPCVAVFCIGNEMHHSAQYPEVAKMVEKARALAPTKLIMDNCGWGEYDRSTADIFAQHMGYFLPYAHHADMFVADTPWRWDGSAYQVPLMLGSEVDGNRTEIYRHCEPVKPTLSHEAMHYIDIPDYAALEKKFDEFCLRVGPEYLEKHGIKKPKYFEGLRKLIAQRGLEDIMPEYIAATQKMRKTCFKIFLEKLRLSYLCGHEMLQFSDCFKYENKNGLVDFFDDDKDVDPAWMRSINGEIVLVADIKEERVYEDDTVEAEIYISNFLENFRRNGILELTLDGERVYLGENFELAGGLQKLVALKFQLKRTGKAQFRTLAARFISGELEVSNSWKIWTYPRVRPVTVPGEIDLAAHDALAAYLNQGEKKSGLYITDTLNQKLLDRLAEGKTAVLLYEYKAERNTWDVQGAKDLFKPCIWDRGSNLGGILPNKALEEALGDDRYYDRNVQPLLFGGLDKVTTEAASVGGITVAAGPEIYSYKVNLDNWPCKVTEHDMGIDKPVRDRYRVSRDGVKGFVPEDTLRRFSHLFSLKVGAGTLVVCTYNMTRPENPVVSNFLELLIDRTDALNTDCTISAEDFKAWLEKVNAEGFRQEDRMNSGWQNDFLAVEQTLFWEDLNMNLAAIKQ